MEVGGGPFTYLQAGDVPSRRGHGRGLWLREPRSVGPGTLAGTHTGLVRRDPILPAPGLKPCSPTKARTCIPAATFPANSSLPASGFLPKWDPHPSAPVPVILRHTRAPRVRGTRAPALAVPGRSQVPWGQLPLHRWGLCSPSQGWGQRQRSAGRGRHEVWSGQFCPSVPSASSQSHRTGRPSHLTLCPRRGGWLGS